MTRDERLRVALGAVALCWINAYICRDWFSHPTAWMNSLHGAWAAVARLAEPWWPYWDAGMPVELTAPPLIVWMTRALAHGGSYLMGVQAVSAIFYCALPMALFLMAWSLTRSATAAGLAGLLYSLVSPAQLIVPDASFAWVDVLGPHRFKLQAVWDETPRCAALTFLLLFLGCVARAVESRRRRDIVAAAVALALALLASPWAAASAAAALLCLLTAIPCTGRAKAFVAGAACLLALALTARYLPPSLWAAMVHNPGDAWKVGQLKYVTGAILFWVILTHFAARWNIDWRMSFFTLWVLVMVAVPVLAVRLNWNLLPQANRFGIELEAAVALWVVFALRPWMARLPRKVRVVFLLAALAAAGVQTIHFRRIAKDILYPRDVTQTLEYRVAQRVARELPGERVLLPGSIATWANAFTNTWQMSGGEGSARSAALRRALYGVHDRDAAEAVRWLQAYGVSAVVVPNSGSAVFWKEFDQPEKFEGVLPVLWREDGVTAYRVPDASMIGVGRVETFKAPARTATADDDPGRPSLPGAEFSQLEQRGQGAPRGPGGPPHLSWFGAVAAGDVISVRVTYHPGWRATMNGRPAELHRDELGLMYVRADSAGPVQLEMTYGASPELRFCGGISLVALLAAAVLLVRGGRW